VAFVQIIEMRTKNYEQLQALGDEFFAESAPLHTGEARGAARCPCTTVGVDRAEPGGHNDAVQSVVDDVTNR
jgi:hypothetical protein